MAVGMAVGKAAGEGSGGGAVGAAGRAVGRGAGITVGADVGGGARITAVRSSSRTVGTGRAGAEVGVAVIAMRAVGTGG
jgi:hypothetical protein